MIKNMRKFDKNEWAHFHDVILDATWKSSKTELNQIEMENMFNNLPEELQEEAKEYGMNDTIWN